MDIRAVFDALDMTMIEDYVARQQEEHVHLEFKLVDDAVLNRTEDKRNVARALSGFANAAGGLVVWGVDARKNAEDIDCAVGLREIHNVARFITRLNELTGEAVDPPVRGVQHRAIQTSGGKGYAVTLVPESDLPPHMAKLGDNRYYQRISDSFLRMEHYTIADMFGRRRRPKLALTVAVQKGIDAQIVIALRNDGRGSAHAPYLGLSCDRPFLRSQYGIDGNMNEGMPLLRASAGPYMWQWGESTNFTIHPGIEHQVARLNMGLNPKSAPTHDLELRYAIACEDQPVEHNSLTIPIGDLV